MLEKKFYLVVFYSLSDAREKELVYASSPDDAIEKVKSQGMFAQLIDWHFVENPVSLGYFPAYVARLVAKG